MTYEVFLPLVTVSSVLVGVGATYHQCEYMPLVEAKWYYDWSLTLPICQGVETVPMIYGERHVGKPIGGNSEWVLWFNEGSNPNQANLTPQQAAQLWNENVDLPVYAGRKHVSPADYDLAWLGKFLALVNRKPDALAVHYYAYKTLETESTQVREFLRSAVDLAKAYGILEVWLTEWASLPGYMGQEAALEWQRRMLAEILPSFPQITRHAWFQLSYRGDESWAWGTDCNTSLVDINTGQITPFGVNYRDRGRTSQWDDRADVVPNGKIDILDLSYVAAHFGEKKGGT